MLRSSRTVTPAVVVLGLSVLSACGARGSAAPDPPDTSSPTPRFTLNTPVYRIVADPDGRAVLDRDLPGLTSNPSYVLFSDMSLAQLAPMSSGRLTQASLDKVRADLMQVK